MRSVADRERRRRFLRRGSIPLFVHGLLEYGLGVLFIAAPSLFSFDSNGATVLSILIGAVILVMAVTTEGPTGLIRNLPLDSHIVIDYVLSAFVIVSPFIFGFRDDDAALAFFIVIGVAYLLLSFATRYRKRDD
jgi:hypothetical protein